MGQVLEFVNIYKAFPGVQALQDVSFRADGGKVTALMGENGARHSAQNTQRRSRPDRGHVTSSEVKHFMSRTNR